MADPTGRRVVYKYAAPIEDSFSLELPVGAEILHLDAQRDVPCLWALVDPSDNAKKEARVFFYVGTGHKHPARFWRGLKHVGTVQLESGSLVYHLFERVDT